MTATAVMVLCTSETARLRLTLMIEAEGGQARFAGESAEGVCLVVAEPGAADRSWTALGVPVLELPQHPDWSLIRLRVRDALTGEVGEDDRLASALVGARILVVDDSATYREYLRGELGRVGAQVVPIADSEAAMARLMEGGWDCILFDLVMPHVDGLELMRRAAAIRRLHHSNFVLAILSSREGTRDMVRSLEAGADAFFGKSMDMAMIKARLASILRFRQLIENRVTS
jgi:CheY-like chemotaxis protein